MSSKSRFQIAAWAVLIVAGLGASVWVTLSLVSDDEPQPKGQQFISPMTEIGFGRINDPKKLDVNRHGTPLASYTYPSVAGAKAAEDFGKFIKKRANDLGDPACLFAGEWEVPDHIQVMFVGPPRDSGVVVCGSPKAQQVINNLLSMSCSGSAPIQVSLKSQLEATKAADVIREGTKLGVALQLVDDGQGHVAVQHFFPDHPASGSVECGNVLCCQDQW